MHHYSTFKLTLADELQGMGRSTPLHKSKPALVEHEIDCVSRYLASIPGRTGTLRQLFADHWDHIRSARSFGRRFKRSVLVGALPNLWLKDKKKCGSLVYEILSGEVAANDARKELAA